MLPEADVTNFEKLVLYGSNALKTPCFGVTVTCGHATYGQESAHAVANCSGGTEIHWKRMKESVDPHI